MALFLRRLTCTKQRVPVVFGRSSLFSTEAESHSDFMPQRKVVNENEEALSFIDKAVKEHKVLLFMKGNPKKPQCGFSAQVVRVLHSHGELVFLLSLIISMSNQELILTA
jgi:hypothetical protein